MNDYQLSLHKKALKLAQQHAQAEFELTEVLLLIEREKLFKELGKRNLFVYVVDTLKLSESVAYALIAVAHKTVEIPALKFALRNRLVTVYKVSRMLSILKPENAAELIAFAAEHTTREVDFEVAKRNPKAKIKNRVRLLAEDVIQFTLCLTKSEYEDFKRVESLEAQRQRDPARTFQSLLECYLFHHDPVKKAQRAPQRGASRARRKSARRVRFTAAEKHEVNRRDEGRCTFVDAQGKRCNEDRWVHFHHKKSVCDGGTNDPDNLTTLCAFHHDLVHQMELPGDWRAPH